MRTIVIVAAVAAGLLGCAGETGGADPSSPVVWCERNDDYPLPPFSNCGDLGLRLVCAGGEWRPCTSSGCGGWGDGWEYITDAIPACSGEVPGCSNGQPLICDGPGA